MCRNAIRATGLLAGVTGAILLAGWLTAGKSGLVLGLLGAAAVMAIGYGASEKLALRTVRAQPISEIQYPKLYRVVRELATDARQPVPRIYLAQMPTPIAFAVGHGPRRAGICVTTGLLRVLDERELRGVLAHELSHIYNRDVLLSSMTVTVAVLITWIANLAWLLPLSDSEEEGGPGLLNVLLFLVVGPAAALAVQVGVSRVREYRADAAAAHLTGDPEGLANALRKVEEGIRAHPAEPDRGMLAASHLMIAHPLPRRGMSRLFAAHPPMGERIRRLENMRNLWF